MYRVINMYFYLSLFKLGIKIYKTLILILLNIIMRSGMMEQIQNFQEVKQRFINADLQGKIEIYTSTNGLTVDQFKELLRHFPIQHLDKLEKAMA